MQNHQPLQKLRFLFQIGQINEQCKVLNTEVSFLESFLYSCELKGNQLIKLIALFPNLCQSFGI